MYLLPYNFPHLFRLLSNLNFKLDQASHFKKHVPSSWTNDFIIYLKNTPSYYWQPIHSALVCCKLSHLWPSIQPPPIIAKVAEYTAKMRTTSTIEFDRKFGAKQLIAESRKIGLEMHDICRILKGSLQKETQQEQDLLHTVPISEMGNYTARMSKNPVLMMRSMSESPGDIKNRNPFGNPYKNSKKQDVGGSIDDDIDARASIPSRRKKNGKRIMGSKYRLKPMPICVPTFGGFSWADLESKYAEVMRSAVADLNFITEIEDELMIPNVPDLYGADGSEYSLNSEEALPELVKLNFSQEQLEEWKQQLHARIFTWPGDVDFDSISHELSQYDAGDVRAEFILQELKMHETAATMP